MNTWSIWDVWDETFGRIIGFGCKLSGAAIDTMADIMLPFTAYTWEPKDPIDPSPDPLAGTGDSSPAVTDETPPSSPAGEHPTPEILGHITKCITCGRSYITRELVCFEWACPACIEVSEDIYDPDDNGGYYFRKIWG